MRRLLPAQQLGRQCELPERGDGKTSAAPGAAPGASAGAGVSPLRPCLSTKPFAGATGLIALRAPLSRRR